MNKQFKKNHLYAVWRHTDRELNEITLIYPGKLDSQAGFWAQASTSTKDFPLSP